MTKEEQRDVQRLHIRSTNEGVSHTAATSWCLENGRAGVGWGLWDENVRAATWEEYVDRADSINSNVRRFHDLDHGSLIWTRELTGEYWLGELTGEWEYRDDSTARKFDLFCTRQVRWESVGTEDNVPGKVVNAFRSQMTLQRIADSGARAYSNRLFELRANPTAERSPVSPTVVLKSLIGAEDLEDLVLVYLQVRFGYVFVSRGHSTPGYEYVLKSHDGQTIVASVKSGDTPVDLDLLPAESADIAYVFSVGGKSRGSTEMRVEEITPQELVTFMSNNAAILPNRVAAWLRTVV